jgi:hypothetical protein
LDPSGLQTQYNYDQAPQLITAETETKKRFNADKEKVARAHPKSKNIIVLPRSDADYNCFAHTQGVYDKPFHQPQGAGAFEQQKNVDLLNDVYKRAEFTVVADPSQKAEFIEKKAAFEPGKIKIVVYGNLLNKPGGVINQVEFTHATIQRNVSIPTPTGGVACISVWESKLGGGPLIWHRTLGELSGYGKPLAVLEKTIK